MLCHGVSCHVSPHARGPVSHVAPFEYPTGCIPIPISCRALPYVLYCISRMFIVCSMCVLAHGKSHAHFVRDLSLIYVHAGLGRFGGSLSVFGAVRHQRSRRPSGKCRSNKKHSLYKIILHRLMQLEFICLFPTYRVELFITNRQSSMSKPESSIMSHQSSGIHHQPSVMDD